LPSQLSGVYDDKEYSRSQEYTRAYTRFGLFQIVFDSTVLLLFWFSGGFGWLDLLVRGYGFGSIETGLLYFGALTVAGGMLSLPFDLYGTFVIEERFGFNRTTFRLFVLDRLKGMLLGAILGIPLLSAILWFFGAAGGSAWLYCWLFSTVFLLIVQFIAPTWIMPWFNKFTPLPDGELKAAISKYAESVRFAFKDVFVMDASKRSSKANAFFTGFGRNKRIALFDTLVQDQTVPEVVCILAHEIGHYKKNHVPAMMILSVAHTGFLFWLMSHFLNNRKLTEAFFVDEPSIYTGLLFFGMLYEPVSFLLSIATNVLSRRNELQADRFAVDTLGEPEHMASALKKLHVKNLSNLTPHPFFVFLNYSHPPLLQRIKAIRVPIVSKSINANA